MLAPDVAWQQEAPGLAQQEPAESHLFLLALRAAKEASLEEFNKEDTNKKRLEERIRPFQLFVNEDTDNTGDCQFDAAADQLRGIPGHEHLTKELVRKTVTDWLRVNPDYRLSHDPANVDTLSTWIRDTQGLEWKAYVDEMAKPKAWGDEVTMKAIVEVYNVKILLWSSTVSEANYFSVHRPKADDGSEAGTLCLCHFLEVHYGSLLSRLEYARRQAEKREQFMRVAQHLSPDQRLDALCDVFLHDNRSPGSVALLDRGIVAAALETSGGNLQLTFERLANAMGLDSQQQQLHIPLRRVQQYRAKLSPAALAALLGGSSAAGGAEMQQELSRALALLSVLKEENAQLRAENASLRTAAPAARVVAESAPAAAARKEDSIVCGTLVDEDGRKWLRVAWHVASAQRGDMLTLTRLALFGNVAKLLARTPASGDPEGAAIFEYPQGIQHVRVAYSRKGTELAGAAPFLCGPEVQLALQTVQDASVQLTWSSAAMSEVTSSDWVGLYKLGDSNTRNYEAYAHVDPATSVVTIALDRAAAKLPLTARFFNAANRYYPVAEVDLQQAQ